jgi:hypothetical protein
MGLSKLVLLPVPDATKPWKNPITGHAQLFKRKPRRNQALVIPEYDVPFVVAVSSPGRSVRLGSAWCMHTITWIARRLKDVRSGGKDGMQLVKLILISPNAFTSICALFWNVVSPRWSASLRRVGGAVGGNSFL